MSQPGDVRVVDVYGMQDQGVLLRERTVVDQMYVQPPDCGFRIMYRTAMPEDTIIALLDWFRDWTKAGFLDAIERGLVREQQYYDSHPDGSPHGDEQPAVSE